jgi:hypothetical protein
MNTAVQNTPSQIRAQAALLLMQVADEGRSLDALLENRSDAPQERGLLRSLSYGSVRWYWRLLAALTKLSSQHPKELQPEVRALALVGLANYCIPISPLTQRWRNCRSCALAQLNRATGFLVPSCVLSARSQRDHRKH